MPTLEELEAVARGAAPAPLDGADRERIAAARAVVEAALESGDGGLRRHDRLRPARERADRAVRRRAAAGQPAALARGRLRPAAAGGGRARDAAAARLLAAARPLGRAGRAGRAGARPARARRHAGDPEQGLGRLVGRPRAARAPRAGADRRGRGDVRRASAARRRGARARRPRAGRADGQGGARAHQRHAPDGGRRRARACATPRGCSTPRSSRWRSRSRRSRARPSRSTRACTRCAASPGRRRSRRGCARCSPAARSSRATPTAAACRTRTRCAARRRCSARSPTRSTTCSGALERELEAVTDNPLVFPDDGDILSGGNFHGQPLSLPLDHLALALCELASFSERRIVRAALPRLRRAAAVPDAAARALVGPDDRPVRRRRARQRVPGARAPGGRGLDPDERRPGGLQLDGRAGALKARTVVENAAQVVATELVCAVPGARVPPAAAQHRRRSRPRAARVREYVPRVEEDRSLAARAGRPGRRAAHRGGGRWREVPRLAAGGRAADAREQPASRRRRAAARSWSSTAGSARRRATRRRSRRSSAS